MSANDSASSVEDSKSASPPPSFADYWHSYVKSRRDPHTLSHNGVKKLIVEDLEALLEYLFVSENSTLSRDEINSRERVSRRHAAGNASIQSMSNRFNTSFLMLYKRWMVDSRTRSSYLECLWERLIGLWSHLLIDGLDPTTMVNHEYGIDNLVDTISVVLQGVLEPHDADFVQLHYEKRVMERKQTSKQKQAKEENGGNSQLTTPVIREAMGEDYESIRRVSLKFLPELLNLALVQLHEFESKRFRSDRSILIQMIQRILTNPLSNEWFYARSSGSVVGSPFDQSLNFVLGHISRPRRPNIKNEAKEEEEKQLEIEEKEDENVPHDDDHVYEEEIHHRSRRGDGDEVDDSQLEVGEGPTNQSRDENGYAKNTPSVPRQLLGLICGHAHVHGKAAATGAEIMNYVWQTGLDLAADTASTIFERRAGLTLLDHVLSLFAMHDYMSVDNSQFERLWDVILSIVLSPSPTTDDNCRYVISAFEVLVRLQALPTALSLRSISEKPMRRLFAAIVDTSFSHAHRTALLKALFRLVNYFPVNIWDEQDGVPNCVPLLIMQVIERELEGGTVENKLRLPDPRVNVVYFSFRLLQITSASEHMEIHNRFSPFAKRALELYIRAIRVCDVLFEEGEKEVLLFPGELADFWMWSSLPQPDVAQVSREFHQALLATFEFENRDAQGCLSESTDALRGEIFASWDWMLRAISVAFEPFLSDVVKTIMRVLDRKYRWPIVMKKKKKSNNEGTMEDDAEEEGGEDDEAEGDELEEEENEEEDGEDEEDDDHADEVEYADRKPDGNPESVDFLTLWSHLNELFREKMRTITDRDLLPRLISWLRTPSASSAASELGTLAASLPYVYGQDFYAHLVIPRHTFPVSKLSINAKTAIRQIRDFFDTHPPHRSWQNTNFRAVIDRLDLTDILSNEFGLSLWDLTQSSKDSKERAAQSKAARKSKDKDDKKDKEKDKKSEVASSSSSSVATSVSGAVDYQGVNYCTLPHMDKVKQILTECLTTLDLGNVNHAYRSFQYMTHQARVELDAAGYNKTKFDFVPSSGWPGTRAFHSAQKELASEPFQHRHSYTCSAHCLRDVQIEKIQSGLHGLGFVKLIGPYWAQFETDLAKIVQRCIALGQCEALAADVAWFLGDLCNGLTCGVPYLKDGRITPTLMESVSKPSMEFILETLERDFSYRQIPAYTYCIQPAADFLDEACGLPIEFIKPYVPRFICAFERILARNKRGEFAWKKARGSQLGIMDWKESPMHIPGFASSSSSSSSDFSTVLASAESLVGFEQIRGIHIGYDALAQCLHSVLTNLRLFPILQEFNLAERCVNLFLHCFPPSGGSIRVEGSDEEIHELLLQLADGTVEGAAILCINPTQQKRLNELVAFTTQLQRYNKTMSEKLYEQYTKFQPKSTC